MKYIIWHKLIYLVLIFGDLLSSLVIIFKRGEETAYFPYIYIDSFALIVSSLPLIRSSLFFALNYFLLKRMLRHNLNSKLLSLEQFLSLCRMLMSLTFASIPISIYVAFWIFSPVSNSLWAGITSISTDMSFMKPVCLFLIGLEVLYITLLTRNKEKLSTLNPFTEETLSPEKNSISTLNNKENKPSYWQIKVVSLFGKVFIAGLAGIVLIMLIGKPDDPTTIKQIDLMAPYTEGTQIHRLQIAKAYIRSAKVSDNGSTIRLNAVYPGMLGFSRDIRKRFSRKIAEGGGDKVEIVIRKKAIKRVNSQDSLNPNDLGNAVLTNRLLHYPNSYPRAPLTEEIEGANLIKKYKHIHHKDHEGEYELTAEDQRKTVVTCTGKMVCRANTTWKGELGIFYRFNRKHFQKMIDLDRSVVALVDSFKPKLIIKGG